MGTCRTQCKPGLDVVRTQKGGRMNLKSAYFTFLTTSSLRSASTNSYIFFVNVVKTWPGVTTASTAQRLQIYHMYS